MTHVESSSIFLCIESSFSNCCWTLKKELKLNSVPSYMNVYDELLLLKHTSSLQYLDCM